MKSTIVTEKAAVEIKKSTGKKDHFNSLIIATLILKAETQSTSGPIWLSTGFQRCMRPNEITLVYNNNK